jgi:2-amino-4-hydroxy-6-hydroxymethyldihydropteridine diphosphokinase
MHLRRFVLEPLVEIAPEARHPVLGKTARELLAALGGEQTVRRL